MKKIIFLIILFFVGNLSGQTNLVPNGNFDDLINQYNGGTDPVAY